MKPLKIEAHNVQRLRDITLDLTGHHLYLVGGKTDQGKTSVLKAFTAALCGRSGSDYPEILLREGEKEGWVRVDLSGSDELHDELGFTAELYLKRRRNGTVAETFRLLDSTGEEAPSPRAILHDLYTARAFDPLAFEKLDKRAKREHMMKLLGIDFTESNERREEIRIDRLTLGKLGASKKALAEGMPHYPEAPEEEVSTEDLFDELQKRNDTNNANRKLRQSLTAKGKELQENESELRAVGDEIKELEAKLKALRSQQADLQAKSVALTTEKADLEEEVAAAEDVKTDDIRAELRKIDELNEQVRANAARKKAFSEVDELKEKYNSFTDQLKELDEQDEKQIAAAEWPVEGMSFDDEGILLNGLPFEQASRRQRITASFLVGMKMNPTLRLLICEDGSSLDYESMEVLDELLTQHDFLAVVELVTRSEEDEDRCAVIIEDGAAH